MKQSFVFGRLDFNILELFREGVSFADLILESLNVFGKAGKLLLFIFKFKDKIIFFIFYLLYCGLMLIELFSELFF